jgi:LysM repeat protein
VNRLGALFLLLIIFGATAVACAQPQTITQQTVALPPTTTPLPVIQNTAVSRPVITDEALATPTITLTLTSTLTRTAVTYTIQPGDTLANISSRFEVPMAEIAEANNLTNPNAITAGQTLIIPQEVAVTAVPPSNTPEPTATPTSDAGSESGDGGTAVPPEQPEPTGRLELTHPLTMVIEESGVITVEIIADPELSTIGEHEPHVTGVVRIDASYTDGERAFYEQTIELFPLMSAELNAPAFAVFPSGGDNVRLPRVISTTLPAVWTWDIIATNPGDAQVITLNLYKEPEADGGLPILTQSISRNIQVVAKSLWIQLVDSLADNVLILLGAGGPLGLLLAYLTYRTTQENSRLKKEVASHKRSDSRPETENKAVEDIP